MKTILTLSNEEAKDYFLRNSNYCNIRLPKYFNFEPLLKKLVEYNNTINGEKAKDSEKVNYILYHNKDGMFAWRPLQLINPVLYTCLLSTITSKKDWETILDRFKKFQEDKSIRCCSIPLLEEMPNEAILNWWNEIEQQSVEYALEYNCMLVTDITDCYGSIYTHTIAWAIHGKDMAKQERENRKLLGNKIDSCIRSMSNGQTNGIPQGSALMDFIAEMVLGYADMELSNKIKEYNETHETHQLKEYKVLRYRDDYRIFGKNKNQVVKIAKLLSEVLQDLNLRLNSQKTFISDNVIKDSLKPDKYYWNEEKREEKNIQKRLLLIHSLSLKFPNSGSLETELRKLADQLKPLEVLKDHSSSKVLISIIIDIAFKNPRIYPIACSIISEILSFVINMEEQRNIYNMIVQKFDQIPNTGYMKVWLQRIMLKKDVMVCNDPLCKSIYAEGSELWNIDWIKNDNVHKVFKTIPIVDKEELEKCTEILYPDEIRPRRY